MSEKTIEELANEAQGGSGKKCLNILHRIEVKGIPIPVEGHPTATYKDPYFTIYKKGENGAEGKNINFKGPIVGFLVGKAMKIKSFDRVLKGSFNSGYYFRNSNVIDLWAPGNGKSVKAFTGNIDQIVAYLALNSSEGKGKKLACLFVATKDGLVEIQTNLSCWIDQSNAFSEKLKKEVIQLTPTMFHMDNKDIGAGAKKNLGDMASTNPPAYASILPIGALTPEMEKAWNVRSHLMDYIEWAKENGAHDQAMSNQNTGVPVNNPMASVADAKVEAEVAGYPQWTPPAATHTSPTPQGTAPAPVVTDDLPF